MKYKFFFGNAIFVPVDHPAAQILKEMELRFGKNFDAFSRYELLALIVFVAAKCDHSSFWSIKRQILPSWHLETAIELCDRLASISNDLAMSLIPFLIAQTGGRR